MMKTNYRARMKKIASRIQVIYTICCFATALSIYLGGSGQPVFASQQETPSMTRWMDDREKKESAIDTHLAYTDGRIDEFKKEINDKVSLVSEGLKDRMGKEETNVSHDEGIAIGGFIVLGALQTVGGLATLFANLLGPRKKTNESPSVS